MFNADMDSLASVSRVSIWLGEASGGVTGALFETRRDDGKELRRTANG